MRAGNTVVSRLQRRIGVLSWRPRANRLPHKRHLKNFAARTGDPFSLSFGDRGVRPKRQRTLRRGFLRSYWSAENSVLSARKKDDFVLFCLGLLNISSPMSSVA